MGRKQLTKREFDWRTYTKPARLLSADQESGFTAGPLAPLLLWARSDSGSRFEIRARQAAIYHHGTLLIRIRGTEPHFVGEIDANVRLPRAERSGSERLETWPLSSAEEVAACLAELDALRELTDGYRDASVAGERADLQRFAAQNSASTGPILVVDTEYQYGKRRFDFVAMRRAEGVAGPSGFTTPRLVVGQFKCVGRPIAGTSGLAASAADFAEFASALAGAHLARAKAELGDLTLQKQRLGLLPADVPFRHFTQDAPEYLVVLAGFDLSDPELDAPIAEVHERLVARHFQPELLRFAGVDESGAIGEMTIGAEGSLSYREFKAYRKRLKG
jgi:hypothetical protein